MSAAVVLSSSPPRIFALSPTSLESSSSLPSLSELFKSDPNDERFWPSQKTRDGFASDFKSAHTPLSLKGVAENVTYRSPGKERFKHSLRESTSQRPRFVFEKFATETTPNPISENARLLLAAGDGSQGTTEKSSEEAGHAVKFHSRPQNLQSKRAVPRRMDWTPPKEGIRDRLDSAANSLLEQTTTLPSDLFNDFTFNGSLHDKVGPERNEVSAKAITKRTRIQLITTVSDASLPKPQVVGAKKSEVPATKKRAKSPTKKAMTITKLATSHYFGQDDPRKISPMIEYLNATQARSIDDSFENETNATEVVQLSKRKSNLAKRRAQKPRLMSPKSAMKAVEEQETVFGSASQLARDEQTKSSSRSDPVSPQQTQPISIESTTPQTGRGTSKFVKTRNLWAVAARDEDNALLYVDTVDLFDTPDMRVAFAGKDVLREPGSKPGGLANAKGPDNGSVIDIYDLDSLLLRPGPHKFGASSSRFFHTSAFARSPTRRSQESERADFLAVDDGAITVTESAPKRESLAPKKPSYAGLPTHDLQKQLSSFGFKPVKKREKMIELLEKCWEEKHGRQDTSVSDDSIPKHGDFLSKVHDISTRPQPRQKKARKRAKDDKGEAYSRKAPKRQKKTSTASEGKAVLKTMRKRKDKTSTLSETTVIDIDEVDSPTAMPPKVEEKGCEKSVMKITPLALIPAQSLPGPVDTTREAKLSPPDPQSTTLTVVATPPLSGTDVIGEKIQAAIMRQSEDAASEDRDHLRNPTWHEKILLYDPIILEDLTAWLNVEGLDRVDEDREVSALEVRDWCENNGVCCLWKGGWRGRRLKGAED